MKFLYLFDVDQLKEVEKEETKIGENQETIVVKTKVQENVPIKFGIKKPSRADKEEADLVRAQYLAQYIQRGLITEAVLNKTYTNQGGTLDEFQKEYLINLQFKYAEKKEEYQLLAATSKDNRENEEKADALLKELIELQQEITKIFQDQSTYFENTAEAKARNKQLEYLFTHLVYHKSSEDKDWESYFKGLTFEDRLKHLEQIEDEGDDVYTQVKTRALFVLSVAVQLDWNISLEALTDVVKENLAE